MLEEMIAMHLCDECWQKREFTCEGDEPPYTLCPADGDPGDRRCPKHKKYNKVMDLLGI